MRRTFPAAIVAGLLFGFLQMVLAFFAAGYGEGSYVPLGLAAAPLALLSVLFRSIWIAFFGLLPLWGGYSLLAARWAWSGQARAHGRKLLLAHNVLGLLVVTLTPGTPYSDWSRFAEYPRLETFYVAVYAASQWMIWWLLPRFDLPE